MRRVLAEELGSVCIPQRNLDQFGEYFFEYLQFFFRDIIKKQILVSIFLHVFGQEPEIVVRVRHHVGQCELFFLRQIYCQFHVVGRTFVRHQPAHILLEEGLSPHHQVREDRLIRGVVTEMLVA